MVRKADRGTIPLAPARAWSAHGHLVRRAALFERMSPARDDGVILVCAPAGSGKSMFVRSWLEDSAATEHTAWVAVEPGERDAQHFWLGVTDALAAALGGSVAPLGPTPGLRGTAVVERMLEDLRSLEEPLTLVIDDLHEL